MSSAVTNVLVPKRLVVDLLLSFSLCVFVVFNLTFAHHVDVNEDRDRNAFSKPGAVLYNVITFNALHIVVQA